MDCRLTILILFVLAVLNGGGCSDVGRSDPSTQLPKLTSNKTSALPADTRLDPQAAALIKQCLNAVNTNAKDPFLRLRLAQAYNANGFDRLAMETYIQTLHLDAQIPEAWYLLALLDAEQGKTKQSLSYLSQAEHLRPDYLPIYYRKAMINLDAGNPDAAEREIAKAQALDDKNLEVRMMRARMALQTGQPQLARDILEQLCADGADHPYIHQLLGTAYQRTGQPERARMELAQASGEKIRLNDPWKKEMLSLKRGFETQYTGALNHLSRGEVTQGIDILRALQEEGQQPVEIANALAAAYAATNRLNEAIEVLRTNARAHPDAGVTHINLSVMYSKQDRLQPALNHAQFAIKLMPHLPAAYLQAARVYLRSDQQPQAIDALDRAFSLGADQNNDRIMYGQVLLTNGRFEEARSQLRAATDSAPESSTAWAGLALAVINLGDEQEGRDYLKRAQMLRPNDPFVIQVQDILNRNRR
ncbi:MAG: tetratricopeptide repeat protein [Phycisphaerales bacterium]|nr:tetratricopeptide repeat protein [Phycisphaerales bacterium]